MRRKLSRLRDSLLTFWFDPDLREPRSDGSLQLGAWVPLPTTIDADARVATTTVDHFSAFQLGNGLSASAAFIPSLQGWQVSAFTGGASYSYALDVPAGPGGLKPNLVLSYSSNADDGPSGARKKAQASWVGRGWSLDPGGAISRNKNGCCETWDHFTLSAMGRTFDVVRGNHVNGAGSDATGNTNDLSQWNWHIADEAFWRIRAGSNNTWTAWAPDGVRYEFTQALVWGWRNPDRYETYKWLLREVVDPSGNRISFSYHVDALTPYGTTIHPTYRLSEIRWGYDGATPGTGTARHRLAFVAESRWAAPTEDVDKQWEFGSDQIYTNPADPNAPNAGAGAPHEAYRLKQVVLYSTPPGQSEQPAARWDLSYAASGSSVRSDAVDGQRMLTLSSIARGGYTPATTSWGFLPATTFTYGLSRGTTSPTPPTPGWNRLLTAENGYGGRVRFTYGHIWSTAGHGGEALPAGEGYYESSPYAYRFRVLQQLQEDTAGQAYSSAVLTTYSYTSPALNTRGQAATVWYAQHTPPGQTGDSRIYLARPEKSEFRGHESVIVQVYDGATTAAPLLQRRQSWFYQGKQFPSGCTPQLLTGSGGYQYVNTSDPCYQTMVRHEAWKGRAFKEELQSSSGAALQRTEYTYSRVELPFYNSSLTTSYRRAGLWRAFNYVSAVDETALEGANASTKRTEYFHAASGACDWNAALDSYGRQTCVRELERGNLIRQSVHAYGSFVDATRYIVDRNIASTVLNSASQYVGHSQRFYDGNNQNLGSVGSRGLLTREIAVWNLNNRTLAQLVNQQLDGRDSSYGYDSWGNRTTSSSYAGGGWVKWTGSLWQASSLGNGTAARTTTTAYHTTFRGLPISVTNPLNHTESASYDFRLGTLTSVTDANNRTTSASYDSFGRMLTLVRPGDSATYPTVEALYYDTQRPMRYVVKQREVAGQGGYRPTSHYYDGLGRQIQTKVESLDPGAQSIVTDVRYDGLGQVTRQSRPRYVTEASSTTFWAYTPTPGSGLAWTTTSYDPLGRVSSVTDPDGDVTAHRYGVLSDGLRWHDVTDPRRHRTQERFDAMGRRVQLYEITGNCATDGMWGYSCGGTFLTSWAPGIPTNYTYNSLDLLIQVSDAKGNNTWLSYDSLGRKTGMSEPNMGSWLYAYDANGNLTSQTDAKSQTISFGYDTLGRLTSKTAPNWANYYGYDQALGDGKGRRTSMSAWLNGQRHAYQDWYYDSRGRIDATWIEVSGVGQAFYSSYDSADRLRTLVYPQGETLTYSYDAAWRQTAVCSSGTSITGCYATGATYTAENQPAGLQTGNSAVTSWGYDGSGRLTSLRVGSASSSGAFFNRSYEYDAADNLTKITNQGNGQQQTFTYDHRDRLLSWVMPGVNQAYSYDTIGNLVSKAGVSYSYGSAGNGTGSGPHQARVINGQSYSYDANGNLTSGGGRSYSWNVENLPTSISVGGTTESYRYNADGQRVSRVVGSQTTVYLGESWEEDVVGGQARSHVLLNGVPVAVVTWSGTTAQSIVYLHQDHLGSISVATSAANGSPVLLNAQEFDPWGAVRSGGISQTRRNYTGQQRDGTGLLYYNARYYDPAIGRFISADTIVPGSNPLTVWPSDSVAGAAWSTRGSGPANPQDLNRYTYVHNNPVRHTDPTGHCIGPVIIACGAAAAAGFVEVVVTAVVGAGVVTGAAAAGAYAGEVYAAAEANPDAVGSVGGAEGLPTESGVDYGPASSAPNSINLKRQLASEEQLAEEGTVMAGGDHQTPFRGADRAAKDYGGKPEDWTKKTSGSYRVPDGSGRTQETHWIENRVTGQREEVKTKLQRPNSAPVRQ